MLEVSKILLLKEKFILHKLDLENSMFRLFNIENGDSFKLNEISFSILSLFDGKRSIEEIRNCILDKYPDENPDFILRDFSELMENMEKEDIFEERRSK